MRFLSQILVRRTALASLVLFALAATSLRPSRRRAAPSAATSPPKIARAPHGRARLRRDAAARCDRRTSAASTRFAICRPARYERDRDRDRPPAGAQQRHRDLGRGRDARRRAQARARSCCRASSSRRRARRPNASKVASTVNVLDARAGRDEPGARIAGHAARDSGRRAAAHEQSRRRHRADRLDSRRRRRAHRRCCSTAFRSTTRGASGSTGVACRRAMLDHVEVVEGGTSSLYGNGAMGGMISFFSRPLAPGAVRLLGRRRQPRHASRIRVPRACRSSARSPRTSSGDYQEGGGYNAVSIRVEARARSTYVVGRSSSATAICASTTRRRRNLSAFVDRPPLRRQPRHRARRSSYQTRDQRDVELGARLRRISRRRCSPFARGTAAGRESALERRPREFRDVRRRRAIRASARTRASSRNIPSHDWGASAMWTRGGAGTSSRSASAATIRRYEGDFDEVDFNTTCPGANCGNVARTISSGGDQALSGAFAQAIAAPIEPLRVELSARVDRWDNNNGHSVDAAARRRPTYADRSKNAFSPRLGVRYQLIPTLAFHGARTTRRSARRISPSCIASRSARRRSRFRIPISRRRHAFGREVGARLAAGRVDAAQGHVVRRRLQGLQRPRADLGAARRRSRQRLNVSKSRSKGGEAYLALRPDSAAVRERRA